MDSPTVRCRCCGAITLKGDGRCSRCRETDFEIHPMRNRAPLEAAGVIYFIQAEDGGPVKIGRALDPELRLRALQIGNPYRLVIRKTFPGDSSQESYAHWHFRHHRLMGEWFEPVPELVALFEADVPPEWWWGQTRADPERCEQCDFWLPRENREGRRLCSACERESRSAA